MSAPEKSLLYIINHMDWFWSHRLPLAQGAQGDGWRVAVAAAGAGENTRLKTLGFSGHDLPPADQGFAPWALGRIMWAVHRLLIDLRPDAVHVITLKYAFIAGLAARAHPHVKIVFTIAGLGYLFSGEGLKPALLRAVIGPFLKLALKHPRAQIIFQNPDDRYVMIRRGFVRAQACHLIRGSGVDLTAFPACPPVAPGPEAPLVVMPTRLVRDKGIAVFIEAAGLLAARGVNARYQIAGGTTRHNPLALSEAQMHELIAGTPVEWTGKVEDMAALYARAAVVCYPSYYGEGVPKVLLEAAASARPIVTTDHPGCREVVREGDNGFLVPVRNAPATAAALEKLIGDAALRAQMGAAGRKRAEEEFDVRLIVRQTLSVYNTALVS